MINLDFSDKTVTYEQFVHDLAASIVDAIAERRSYPETMTQRTAFRIFGRANVERWRRELKVHPCRRPGKLEYRTAELRRQQRKDY